MNNTFDDIPSGYRLWKQRSTKIANFLFLFFTISAFETVSQMKKNSPHNCLQKIGFQEGHE